MVAVYIRIVAGIGEVSIQRNEAMIGRLIPKVENYSTSAEYSIGDIYKFHAYAGPEYEFEKFEIFISNNPVLIITENPTSGTIVTGLENINVYFKRKGEDIQLKIEDKKQEEKSRTPILISPH